MRQRRRGALILACVGAAGLVAAIGFGLVSWRPAVGSPSQQAPVSAGDSAGVSPGTMFEVNPSAWASDSRCTDAALGYGRTQADYGDAFLSEPAFVLNFTGEPERHVIELRRTVQPFCNIKVRVVAHSLTQLEGLRIKIAADLESLKSAGVDVTVYYIDPISNTVVIGIYPTMLSPDVKAELERRYPADMISVKEQPRAYPVTE